MLRSGVPCFSYLFDFDPNSFSQFQIIGHQSGRGRPLCGHVETDANLQPMACAELRKQCSSDSVLRWYFPMDPYRLGPRCLLCSRLLLARRRLGRLARLRSARSLPVPAGVGCNLLIALDFRFRTGWDGHRVPHSEPVDSVVVRSWWRVIFLSRRRVGDGRPGPRGSRAAPATDRGCRCRPAAGQERPWLRLRPILPTSCCRRWRAHCS